VHQLVNKKNFDNIKLHGMYEWKNVIISYIAYLLAG